MVWQRMNVGNQHRVAKRRAAQELKVVAAAFTEQVVARMSDGNMRRAELARRIGTTRPNVTQALRGRTNFTLESMVRIAKAMNCHLDVRLVPDPTEADAPRVRSARSESTGS